MISTIVYIRPSPFDLMPNPAAPFEPFRDSAILNRLMDDAMLVQAIREGDRDAFGQLLDRYQSRVFRLACRLVSPTEAEDATQEVFIAIHKGLRNYRAESSLSTWIYRVAFNTCQTYRLKNARRSQEVSLEEFHDTGQADRGVLEGCIVAEAMEKLDAPHRDVVVLHELHGLTYAEIADIVQAPIGTVKSRLFHAMRKLRALLGDRVEAVP